MKTVTVTTLRSINYGAVLQAYSLHRFQKDLGIDNCLLDVPKARKYAEIPHKLSKATAIVLYSNLVAFLRRKKRKTLFSKFDRFVSERFKLTENVYVSPGDFGRYRPDTDCYICGSDQVFTMRGTQNDLRKLNFDAAGALKLSYAASLGEYDWSEPEKAKFTKIISQYAAVSVREASAKDYIERQTGIPCRVNIDPVFLTTKEQWSELAAERLVKEEYILCFPLLGNANMQKAADKLKQQTGYKIVSVQTTPMKRIKADRYFFDAGPEEFLSLVKHAAYVLTSSFHGTAFSVLFEKPFASLVKKYRPERMQNLLKLTGLEDCLYFETDSIDNISIEKTPDFAASRSAILQERQNSRDYFREIEQLCENKNSGQEICHCD